MATSTTTTSGQPGKNLRTLTRVSLALSLTFGITLSAIPALAHDQLVQSSPAEGAALASAPTEIILEYSDSVLTIGALVLLVDEHGKNWIDEDPQYDDRRVVTAVGGDPPDGAYEVRWRVVSVDGHPISGVIPFTIGEATLAAREGPSSDSQAEVSSGPRADTGDDEFGGGLRTVFIGIGGAATSLLVLFVVATVRRKRRATLLSRTPSP